jgi:hypothetical protein
MMPVAMGMEEKKEKEEGRSRRKSKDQVAKEKKMGSQ